MSGATDFQAFVREAFANLTTQFGGVNARFDGVNARFDGIDARLDRIEKRQDSTEAELIKVRTEIMARIDRMQSTMDSVREDVAVNMAAAGTAMNNVRNIRSDFENLFDMVMTMHRQQMKLTERVDELSKPPNERSH